MLLARSSRKLKTHPKLDRTPRAGLCPSAVLDPELLTSCPPHPTAGAAGAEAATSPSPADPHLVQRAMPRSLLVSSRSQDPAPPRTSHGHEKRLRDRPEPGPSQRPALCRTWAGNDPRGRTTTAFGAPRGPSRHQPSSSGGASARRSERNAATPGRSRAGRRRSGGAAGAAGARAGSDAIPGAPSGSWGRRGGLPRPHDPPLRRGRAGTLRRRGRVVRERLPGSACFGLRPGEAAGCASRSAVR